jgi:hypothetical protein
MEQEQLVLMASLDLGHPKNLVGQRPNNLCHSRSVRPSRQLLEGIGEIDVRVMLCKVDEDGEDSGLSKLPGLIGEAGRYVIFICLQAVDKALKEVCQLDARGLMFADGEGPALHVHLGDLGGDVFGYVDQALRPEVIQINLVLNA